MSSLEPTSLESALFREFHVLYSQDGFPPPQEISILKRENTGAGRYLTLSSTRASGLEDGYLDLGGKFIEMQGIPNGMMAVAIIANGSVTQLEIAVYGGDPWDGSERSIWAIK